MSDSPSPFARVAFGSPSATSLPSQVYMALRDWLDPYTMVKWAAMSALVAVGGVGTMLYLVQTTLIYPSNVPSGSREQVETPDQFDMPDYEHLTLTTPDGVRIRAFLMLQQDKPETKPTVLLLHANAGNVGHRLPIAKVFYKKMNANILALSYRGYGLSEGKANEKGLMLDAQTALDYILSHPTLEKTQIFLYGQSIGGAVAIFLASQNAARTHGLIVENTFLSLPKLVPMLLPFLSPFIPFLLHQIWPSESRIQLLPQDYPALFLAGEEDELVKPVHMKELYRLCSSERKEWKGFRRGTHNDTCLQPGYFHEIALFLAKYTTSSSTVSSSSIAAPAENATSEDGSVSAESFELVDTEEGREIKDEGGAGSVNLLEKVAEKL